MNSYHDPLGKKSFADVLAMVGELSGVRRVRFTTSHPRDFTPDIVQVIDSMPTVCDHVHLPVQSGSSAVLKAMQREYTREWYLERIAWIKSAKRDISMTTDIIVGFPGETEEDFEETMSLLDVVGYDGVFAFQYSPRPNTPAVGMSETVSDEVKAARLQRLLDAQRERQRVSYERHLDQIVEVMVEGYNHQRGQVTGRTSQNKTLNFTTASPILPAIGSYLNVRVTKTYPNSLVGEAVSAA